MRGYIHHDADTDLECAAVSLACDCALLAALWLNGFHARTISSQTGVQKTRAALQPQEPQGQLTFI